MADGDLVAVRHRLIQRRQPMGVAGGADDLHFGKALLERLPPFDMVGVVVGDDEMRQRPAAPFGLSRDGLAVRRVDARRRAGGAIMDEKAEIIAQADKLSHLDGHMKLRVICRLYSPSGEKCDRRQPCLNNRTGR